MVRHVANVDRVVRSGAIGKRNPAIKACGYRANVNRQ